VSEWRPIDTAPKDGTEIDIWMSGFRYPNSYWGKVEQAWLDVDGEKLYDIFFEEPTHWMPEPDPPPGLEHGGIRKVKG
jgi:hypothetical protein